MKCKTIEEFEEKIFKLQQLEFEELSSTGKYIGNFLKSPVDVFEDSLKVEKCFHSNYNSESDKSDNLSYLDDRVNMYIESELESENEMSTCYSDHTGSNFGNDECDRNLEDVKLTLCLPLKNSVETNRLMILEKILCLFWIK